MDLLLMRRTFIVLSSSVAVCEFETVFVTNPLAEDRKR